MKLTSIALLILGYGTLIFGEVIQNGDGNSHGEPHQKDIVTNKVRDDRSVDFDYNNQNKDFLLDYFTNKKFPCGKRFFNQKFGHAKSRIIGGVTAVKGAYPWQVNLQYGNSYQYCGGTIIDDHHVLTAARCLSGKFNNKFTVIVGDHDLSKREKTQQHLHIARSFIHPQFNMRTANNDIAIIKTREKIVFDNYVQPACIATGQNFYKPGTKVLVSGWGIWKGLQKPQKLQAAQMVVMDFKKCNRNYINIVHRPLTRGEFCANNAQGSHFKDVCNGDNGGPVIVERNGKFILTGIVSWSSNRCAQRGLSGVHTRVAYYNKWIQNVLMK